MVGQSGVQLQIEERHLNKAYQMEVRTDLSKYKSIIPDDECFISPIVKVLAPTETSTSSYTLRIPHCLDEDDDKSKVKVRIIHGHTKRGIHVPVRAKCNDGFLFYDIHFDFIELHTPHFSKIVCTICETPTTPTTAGAESTVSGSQDLTHRYLRKV